MTGFFIAIALVWVAALWIGYMNLKYGNPLVEEDRKLMEQGKRPELL